MHDKNISVDNLFTYIPKTTINNNKKEENISIKNIKNFHLKTNSFCFSKGSSTFDYLNDLNKDKFKHPKLKPPFLTKSKRSIKIHKNILNNIKNRKKIINLSHKLKTSDSCEFFYKLNKTFMTDKNSLKYTNTKNILFKEDENLINNEKINKSAKTYINIRLRKSNINSEDTKINNLKLQSYNKNRITNYKNNIKHMKENNMNFLYNKIFPKIPSDKIIYNVIDNKLNLLYAEDEKHFENKLRIKNIKLMQKGKKLRKMVLDENYAKDKLNKAKKTIWLLKGITDYAYPDIILQKYKLKNGKFDAKENKLKNFKLPYQVFAEAQKKINLIRAKSLSETIKINNFKKRNINISF